jgi:hypothetical protein
MLNENEYIFKNTGLKYQNSMREHTEFCVMLERHGSRAWLVDIRHNQKLFVEWIERNKCFKTGWRAED